MKLTNSIDYVEHREQFDTLKAAAKALGISRSKYKNLMVKQGDVPVSENIAKFREDWGPDECISELQKLVTENPNRVISRNFIRVHSTMSESTWNRYFGTFHEFKRQAGIVLTRQQHSLERNIAKHVSHDSYRELNRRHSWGDSYKRDHAGPWKKILVGSDLHDIMVDPFWLRVFIDTARRFQPTDICLNGDVFDMPEFSKYTMDPRSYDIMGRVRFVHNEILAPLREACPDANIDLIEGNHEVRLIRQVDDSAPGLKILMENVAGVKISDLLGLNKYEVNYIAKANIAGFTTRDLQREVFSKNKKVYYKTFLACHYPNARNKGLPGWCGHHHKHKMWTAASEELGPIEFHQLGSGCILNASYCDAELAGWSNGFLMAHVNAETRSHTMEYVQLTNVACVGGKYYDRADEESWQEEFGVGL